MAKLHFYYSAMNAGKSTNLLQASYNYQERSMSTILFLPKVDNRSGVGVIASRIGLRANAIVFDNNFNFLQYINLVALRPDCILIDESQFLTKLQVLQLCEIADKMDIPVLAYGIRSDFQGEPFVGSKYLLALADQLIEIKTICFCGKKATMNLRVDKYGNIIRKGDQLDIGGNDKYVSVCRNHFYHNDGVVEPFVSRDDYCSLSEC